VLACEVGGRFGLCKTSFPALFRRSGPRVPRPQYHKHSPGGDESAADVATPRSPSGLASVNSPNPTLHPGFQKKGKMFNGKCDFDSSMKVATGLKKKLIKSYYLFLYCCFCY